MISYCGALQGAHERQNVALLSWWSANETSRFLLVNHGTLQSIPRSVFEPTFLIDVLIVTRACYATARPDVGLTMTRSNSSPVRFWNRVAGFECTCFFQKKIKVRMEVKSFRTNVLHSFACTNSEVLLPQSLSVPLKICNPLLNVVLAINVLQHLSWYT